MTLLVEGRGQDCLILILMNIEKHFFSSRSDYLYLNFFGITVWIMMGQMIFW